MGTRNRTRAEPNPETSCCGILLCGLIISGRTTKKREDRPGTVPLNGVKTVATCFPPRPAQVGAANLSQGKSECPCSVRRDLSASNGTHLLCTLDGIMMDSWRISEWLYVFTDSLQWKVGWVSSETAEAPCFQMRGLDRASTPRRNGRGLDSSLIRQDIRGLEHLNSPRKSLGLLEEAFGGCGSPILRHRRATWHVSGIL
jgi:hypothetical protein